ncbi:hypothetical protein DEFR109230_10445 [Deinococcus frigens]
MNEPVKKRGRKAGRGAIRLHRVAGPHEVRAQLLAHSCAYPHVSNSLRDGLHKALADESGYERFLDALTVGIEPLPQHPAMKYIWGWAYLLGLHETNWAALLAARAIGKARYAPLLHRDNPIVWAALTVSHSARSWQQDGFLNSLNPAGVGFRKPVTGDFPPMEVSEWLAWRLVECQKARCAGVRPMGWTALAERLREGREADKGQNGTGRTDHKTMKKHAEALAEYAGVPITLLE